MDEDSKEQKPIAEPLPEGVTAIVVANQHGAIREALKDEKGRFVKKPKPLIPTIEFTRAERKKLNTVRSDKEGLTEYMVAFMNIVRIAQNEDTDPKAMMAAVKAFEIVRQSALGKFATAEQDLDRLTTQAVKTIIVVAPSLMHPEVIDADKPVEKKTQPTFAEVVDIKTNPKT
jgi:hypothetical protein